jgi:hypothetical protein
MNNHTEITPLPCAKFCEKHGRPMNGDGVCEVNTLKAENERLMAWLRYISNTPNRSLWFDDRDDAAYEMLSAADTALTTEEYPKTDEENE